MTTRIYRSVAAAVEASRDRLSRESPDCLASGGSVRRADGGEEEGLAEALAQLWFPGQPQTAFFHLSRSISNLPPLRI
jgi:hypothetical protein